MVFLSLFDGMQCGRVAAERAGLPVDLYLASEVDKYAITVAQANHPSSVQLGSVENWREWPIDWTNVDVLMGGSPCQGFSSAGKQGGTKATIHGQEVLVTDRGVYLTLKAAGAEFASQSHLFWEYVLCLDHVKAHNPDVKFLLENVKMKKAYLDMISDALGVQPVFINSALVSAQNRQRFYWFNWECDQPEDKGVLLGEVLDAGSVDRKKSYCIDANYVKGGGVRNYLKKKRRQVVVTRCDAWPHVPEVTPDTPVRKLTPAECERLQTVPDGYTDHVSKTQRYKMLGNGWTVDVIAHILRGMPV